MLPRNLCIVPGCKNSRETRNIGFFYVTKPRRKAWLTAVDMYSKKASISASHFICSAHFREEDKTKGDSRIWLKNPDAVPSINAEKIWHKPATIVKSQPLNIANYQQSKPQLNVASSNCILIVDPSSASRITPIKGKDASKTQVPPTNKVLFVIDPKTSQNVTPTSYKSVQKLVPTSTTRNVAATKSQSQPISMPFKASRRVEPETSSNASTKQSVTTIQQPIPFEQLMKAVYSKTTTKSPLQYQMPQPVQFINANNSSNIILNQTPTYKMSQPVQLTNANSSSNIILNQTPAYNFSPQTASLILVQPNQIANPISGNTNVSKSVQYKSTSNTLTTFCANTSQPVNLNLATPLFGPTKTFKKIATERKIVPLAESLRMPRTTKNVQNLPVLAVRPSTVENQAQQKNKGILPKATQSAWEHPQKISIKKELQNRFLVYKRTRKVLPIRTLKAKLKRYEATYKKLKATINRIKLTVNWLKRQEMISDEVYFVLKSAILKSPRISKAIEYDKVTKQRLLAISKRSVRNFAFMKSILDFNANITVEYKR